MNLLRSSPKRPRDQHQGRVDLSTPAVRRPPDPWKRGCRPVGKCSCARRCLVARWCRGCRCSSPRNPAAPTSSATCRPGRTNGSQLSARPARRTRKGRADIFLNDPDSVATPHTRPPSRHHRYRSGKTPASVAPRQPLSCARRRCLPACARVRGWTA